MKIHPHDLLLLELAEEPAARSPLSPRLHAHLAGCPRCRGRLRALHTAAGLPPVGGQLGGRADLPRRRREGTDYGAALARSERLFESWQAGFARERSEATGLLAELLPLPAARRRLLLANSRRFRTWCLCELLVERCRGAEAEDWGRLALELAGRLDPAVYGGERLADLRARAWAHLGDARRLRGDLAGAVRAFEAAAGHLRRGTGELLERATFLELRAALLLDQGQGPAAARLLSRALAVFREAGDDRRAARCLVRLAGAWERQERWPEAIRCLEEAVGRLGGPAHPSTEAAAGADRLLLRCALHSLLLDLFQAGRTLEAQRLLARLRGRVRTPRERRPAPPARGGVGPKPA